jgi:membrane associated rhomboid family serine protease
VSDGGAPVCYRHPDRETYISCARCSRPICPEDMTPASVGFQCPECLREGARSVRHPRTVVGAKLAAGSPVTFTLVGANVLMFLITGTLNFGGQLSRRFIDLALISGVKGEAGLPGFGIADGEYYRLVTSAFLHFGILHLALNMYALVALGPQLEQLLGRWRFATVYGLSALGGSVATYLFASPGAVTAGASGAVFGLFAAFFVIARRIGAQTGPILATIGLNLVFTFAVAQISKTGHLGGLAFGALAAAVFAFAPEGVRRTQLQIVGCAGLFALLVLAVVVGPQ